LKNGKADLKKYPYPPFVAWNAGRLGAEASEKILKKHLNQIIKRIDRQSKT